MSNEHNSVPQHPSDKKSGKAFRFLKRFIFLLFFLIIFIIGAGFLVGYFYQDEVKSYIVSELNKELNTPIIIEGKDIDFTVLKNFPLASLEFKNVKALDAVKSKKKDTLFKADNISLLFNIVDVFNKNYHIKKIIVNGAVLNIRIDKKGNDNYHFLKSSPDNDSAHFSFALEQVVLKKIQLHYKNAKTQQEADLAINKSAISGKFSDEKYSLAILSELYIDAVKADNTTFLRNKKIQVDLAFDVDNNQKLYDIKKGKFTIEDVLFEATGNIYVKDKTLLDIRIKGKELNIQSVLSLIPNKYKERINEYNSEGEFYFNGTVKGKFSDMTMPQLTADFGINNANITQTTSAISLQKVSLTGSFTNGKKCNAQTSALILKSVYAKLNNGSISGELKLEDFDNLLIDSKINASISLEELQRFVKFDTVETISGQLNLDVFLNGKWTDIHAVSAEKSTITGTVQLTDVNFKIKNNILPFTNINGNFTFDNNNLIITDFAGNIANSDFQLKGEFKNIIGFLFRKNETITIDASLNSKNIDLNELLENKEENSASQSPYKLMFSNRIDFNLNSQIAHLEFRKFEASDIKGIVKLRNRQLTVDPIVISTMNGTFSTKGIVDGSDTSKLYISCISEAKNINVTKMFTAFENFGQMTVTNKNIKGNVTAIIQLKTPVSPELAVDMDNLYANIDMTIEKGELNNIESMKSLSRFIELQELMNVRFASLKNQLEVKNKLVTIPKMEINSNAINLLASGTHSFNNDINYKIKLTLDDLLSKKAKKNKKENDEFGEVSEDERKKTNLFLSMTGTVDKPVIKYDTKEAVQQFKQNIKTEKQTVKGLLKEEFGLFKKDTALKARPKKQEQKLKIEWEENKKPNPKQEEKKELKVPKKPVDDEDF
jgi:hypothetical protein